ncbi:MAG: PepSY-like domain-containing protein [Bacteroidia bacterium]|nr:PepSY-like domain-containing protein [Bacteroidia bacterium]
MNKILKASVVVTIFLMGCLSFAVAQELKERNVPSEVKQAFQEKYPNTYVYEWEWKRKKSLYKAEFMWKRLKYEAYFTKEGKWILSEYEIAAHELPEVVHKAIASGEYANWEIDDIDVIHSPEHEVSYEIEVKRNKQKRKLYYLPDGKLLRTEFIK